MLRRLLATSAVLLCAALPARAAEVRPQDPTLEVQQGRSILVQRGSRGAVLYPGSERGLRGECHLRVVAGGRARITWPGIASLRIEGPTEISWNELELSGAALADSGSLEWSFFAVGAVELELRRAGPRILLPGGWTTTPDRGAYRFSSGAGETLAVLVRAGQPLALGFTDPTGHVRPPAVVRAGEAAELSPALLPRSRPDKSAFAPPWDLDQVVWPWGAKLLHWPRDERTLVADARITPDAPRVEVEAPRAVVKPGASRPPVVPSSDVAPVREVEPTSADEPPNELRTAPTRPESAWTGLSPSASSPTATVTAPAEAPPEPRPTDLRLPAPTRPEPAQQALEPSSAFPPTTPRLTDPIETPLPEVAAAVPLDPPPPSSRAARTNEPFDPLHWGGLERGRIRSLSFGELERAPGIAWTQLAAGLWRIENLPGPYEPAWLFTRGNDVLLPAGSSATIDRHGNVLGFQGAVEIAPAPAARPSFDELEPPSATRERRQNDDAIRRRR